MSYEIGAGAKKGMTRLEALYKHLKAIKGSLNYRDKLF